ncbi:MAG: glycosyltransferase family 4 protein [Candidatus Marinimicrobia bacterium]|nr:glycosyltransferase family 4 protein [Candidatus Neomarinimicrobiota bacterium]
MNETHTICHITLGHNPTDDRIFYKEILSLKKRYEKIALVAPDFNPPDPKYNIDYRAFPDGGFIKKLWNAYKLAKQVKADLYHFHEFEFLPFALFLKFKYKRKVIYDAHETIFWFFIDFSRHSKWITVFPALIAHTMELVCAAFMDYIVATIFVAPWFRTFKKRFAKIYNYPVLSFFGNQLADVGRQSRPIILYHGQLVPARKIDLMISAIKYVKPKFPDAKLLIVGNIQEEYKSQLDRLINENRLQDVVELRPPVPYESIPDLLRTACIGFSSLTPNEYFRHSLQIKPFEFMAMGIPVLGCRVPSIEFYVEQTGAGVIVDPVTPENLGNIINDLLDYPEKRIEMGIKGCKAVTEKYNWNVMEKRLYTIYEKLLKC